MKLYFRYILLLLFLTGFSFTGKNQGPLLHSGGSRTALSATNADMTQLQTGQECLHLEQLIYINDNDNDEDVSRLFNEHSHLLLNNLSVYYLSLLERQETIPEYYTGFVHAERPVPAVPRFIQHHQLLIPFQS
ncbi:hypothetical protein CLV59_105399 [Chitinophaga dinghuensis]|uniref:Uncharacterized protein n=1 Tax=Chitinophaga dinghuensis TaxID=1539050 RepID=A0A327VYL6_9BACT|nr:hypothetical protein [Chitinophaga dinghuensis]RAJ80290.1 hypothetical protein CLV59_105399 [Chitinophaga dinghuensis]